jgi:hypothetical protein
MSPSKACSDMMGRFPSSFTVPQGENQSFNTWAFADTYPNHSRLSDTIASLILGMTKY